MKYFYAVALMLLVSTAAFSQKTAYINFQQLIAAMPETKQATDTLQKYQQELAKDGQYLVTEYTRKLQEYDSLATKWTQQIKEMKEKELQDAQTSIQDYRQRMEEKLQLKDQQLLVPIMDKAKKALKAVASEKGYSMVIDNSKEEVLIGSEADDLMIPVKAKLGLK
ncbi:OmpH family outer membrane protein [Chitinophaga oryzae]|uniref:OmpH family outer membrane protein n=1 Tax=Chitinophaga oryzae TaxID=2725414 RepID=A0AAE6ZHE5_9BACT|nr:OmpH family outer membrane protein [Chitinophaga oryzae]QJB33230.1 OmpH family outer membrane protein [Chitinophaga oryzae]QJB39706.1 OmpH family outer membrane protein [Chitinophaga oryzae]